MADLIHLNESNFEETVLKAEGPVLVDFWAEWCGPCKALAPILDELATETDGQATISKVNVDEAGALASKYGIKGIPTIIFFKDGEVKSTLVGNQPKAEILKSLKELM